jgi:hypothetical protein
VFDWISLNTAAIIEYWDGRIDTIELGHLLKLVLSIGSTATDKSY